MNFLKKITLFIHIAIPLVLGVLIYTEFSKDSVKQKKTEALIEYTFSQKSESTLTNKFEHDMFPSISIKAVYLNDKFQYMDRKFDQSNTELRSFIQNTDRLNWYQNPEQNIYVGYSINKSQETIYKLLALIGLIVITLIRASQNAGQQEELKIKIIDFKNNINKNLKVISHHKEVINNISNNVFSDLNIETSLFLENKINYDCKYSTLLEEIESEKVSNPEIRKAINSYKNIHVMNAYQRFERYLGEEFLRTDDREDVLSNIKSEISERNKIISKQSDEINELKAKLTESGNKVLNQANEIEALETKISKTAIQANVLKADMFLAKTKNTDVKNISNDCLAKSLDAVSVSKNASSDMNKIKTFSKKISSIINLIDEIAFQTQLLALNANVEAARAGDHGKGFAVVAGEVKLLATRASESSDQIKKLIEESFSAIESGVSQVENTAESLDSILSFIENITGLVTDINDSSDTQLSNVSDLSNTINERTSTSQKKAIKPPVKAIKTTTNITKTTKNPVKAIKTTNTPPKKTMPKSKDKPIMPIVKKDTIRQRTQKKLDDDIPAHHKNKGNYKAVRADNEDWETF